jgi:hypothetical protein
LVMCLGKQVLQKTGFPGVGLKGTVVILPQSVHLISNIVF